MGWIAKYWLEALFGIILAALSAGFRYIFARLKTQAKEQEAIRGGVVALLRDRLIQTYNEYTEKGYCPIYGLENAESLYKQYHALGGNGTCTRLLEELRALPKEKQPK